MLIKKSFSFTEELYKFAKECEEILKQEKNIIEFKYPQPLLEAGFYQWDHFIDEIEDEAENKTILGDISGNGGLYCLYVKKPKEKWALKYIGITNKKGARQRIRNHLITCSSRTGAKLEEVKKVVFDNRKIGILFIEIEPGALRHTIEEILIECLEPEWNIWNKGKGKSKGVIFDWYSLEERFSYGSICPWHASIDTR